MTSALHQVDVALGPKFATKEDVMAGQVMHAHSSDLRYSPTHAIASDW